MKLFVGSKYNHQARSGVNQFLVLDINEALDIELIHSEEKDLQWGFAWDKDRLFSAHHNKGIVEYDNKANITAEYEAGELIAPHQQLKVGRRIYFVNSGHNEVKVFDLDTNEIVASRAFKGCKWINTLNFIDEQLHIIAHNKGPPSSLIKTDLDLNIIEVVDNVGHATHNVWSMNGALWTCDSANGRLRSLDGLEHINIGGFPRGVAMSEDWLIVGISKQRQTYVEYNAIGLDCPDKGARNGGLAIIDRHTLEVVKYINLQDLTDKTSSNVQEIRLMDERDWASHLDEDNSFFSLDLPN